MILILTQPFDPHADRVETLLRNRGADVCRFNPADFPSKTSISTKIDSYGRTTSELITADQRIDLQNLSAIWYRRPELPEADPLVQDPTQRAMIQAECRGVLCDLWCLLEAAWLPAPPHVAQRAQLKTSQLAVAGRLGFELPPTLVSNDPAALRAFYRQHDGNLISKLAAFSYFDTLGDEFCRYTEPVSPIDIGYARSVRHCPMIIQAYVPKRVELRITVVGREVYAAEIRSQETNHTRHDWRRYDLAKTPHVPHDLPRAEVERCLDLVAELGLSYGAIDMILTPDGRYVFIEINPNGQYLWIEEAAGLPISAAICRHLAEASTPSNDLTCPEFAGATA